LPGLILDNYIERKIFLTKHFNVIKIKRVKNNEAIAGTSEQLVSESDYVFWLPSD